MKIISKDLKRGSIKVRVENTDDLWYLYQVIEKGDIISGRTFRKIIKGEAVVEKKKPVFLKIIAEKIEFHKYAYNLRVLGKIIEGPEDVPLGHYHSFRIEPGSEIKIEKDKWSEYEIRRIEEAVEATYRPKIILCALNEREANFAILKESGVEKVGNVSTSLPSKEYADEYEKAKRNFFIKIAKKLEEMANIRKIDRIVVGAVGFCDEYFMNIVNEKFPHLKKMITTCKISGIDEAAINEIIRSGVIDRIVKGERISMEAKLVERVFKEIAKDGKIVYGIEEVKEAAQMGAVDTLIVSETIVQKYKEEERFSELEEIFNEVERKGGKVHFISKEHPAGEEFEKLGIAALLRFKI